MRVCTEQPAAARGAAARHRVQHTGLLQAHPRHLDARAVRVEGVQQSIALLGRHAHHGVRQGGRVHAARRRQCIEVYLGDGGRRHAYQDATLVCTCVRACYR